MSGTPSAGGRPVIPQEDHKLLLAIWGWLDTAASCVLFGDRPTLLFTEWTLVVCGAIRARLPRGDVSYVQAFHCEAQEADWARPRDPELDRLLRCARLVLDELVGAILAEARPPASAAPPSDPAPEPADATTRPGPPPRDPPAGPEIDYDAIVERAGRDEKLRFKALVEFMRDRRSAPFDEVKDHVHGADVGDGTVRKLASDISAYLNTIGHGQLSFSTSGGVLYRNIKPL